MKVVLTQGCWDLFHIGHLNYLEKCKELGDFLIVGVNADELVEYLKGCPPIIPLEQRVRIVGALKCVDMVFRRGTLLDVERVDRHGIEIFVRSTDFGQVEEGYRNLRELAERNVEIVVISRTPNISARKIKWSCYERTLQEGMSNQG